MYMYMYMYCEWLARVWGFISFRLLSEIMCLAGGTLQYCWRYWWGIRCTRRRTNRWSVWWGSHRTWWKHETLAEPQNINWTHGDRVSVLVLSSFCGKRISAKTKTKTTKTSSKTTKTNSKTTKTSSKTIKQAQTQQNNLKINKNKDKNKDSRKRIVRQEPTPCPRLQVSLRACYFDGPPNRPSRESWPVLEIRIYGPQYAITLHKSRQNHSKSNKSLQIHSNSPEKRSNHAMIQKSSRALGATEDEGQGGESDLRNRNGGGTSVCLEEMTSKWRIFWERFLNIKNKLQADCFGEMSSKWI